MKTIRCPQCNLVNFSTAINCKRCGYFFQDINPVAAENAPSANPVNNFSTHSDRGPGAPNTASQPTWGAPNQANYQTPNYSNYRPSFQGSSPRIKMAVISMIFGILSFPVVNVLVGAVLGLALALIFGAAGFIVGVLISLALLPTSLITGITALVRANRRPNEYGGKGFAIAGIILSGISILVFPIVAAIAVPNVLAARKAANEGAALSSLRTLAAAEETFMGMRVAQDCGDLPELAQNKLIDSVLAGGTKSGYVFIIAKLPRGCEIHAKPVNANGVSATGNRSFYYSTEDRMFRAANKNGELAGKIDAPLE